VQLSRQESLNGICDVAKALAYEWDRAGLELYGTAGAVIIPHHRVKSPYFQPLLNFANAPNGTADAKMPRNAASWVEVLA
jgi:hypothetical protein